MTQPEFLSALAEARPLLWHHAKRMARARATTPADLVQSAALYLWTVRDRLAAHPNPAGAFVTAGRWAMIRHLKREARLWAGQIDSDTNPALLAVVDDEPDEFDTLVALAPERYRDLLDRRYRGGELVTGIAAAAGVTHGAVGQQIERALDHLRERLAG